MSFLHRLMSMRFIISCKSLSLAFYRHGIGGERCSGPRQSQLSWAGLSLGCNGGAPARYCQGELSLEIKMAQS